MSQTDERSDELPDGGSQAPAPQAIAVLRSGVSIVWLIPLVALVIGGWLAYKTYSAQGPLVWIDFNSATGLQAGKTKVKFKDVDVGEVTAIDVNPDLKTVRVTAQLKLRRGPLSHQGYAFLGRAPAGHREPGVRPGDPALGGLYRHRPGDRGGVCARFRGPGGAAALHDLGGRQALHAALRRAGVPEHRLAGLLPPDPGGPGGGLPARPGGQGGQHRDLRLRPPRRRGPQAHPILERERAGFLHLRPTASRWTRSPCCRY